VPWVHPDQSEPITPVLPMGSLQNLHRSLVIDGHPVAVGIQPVGDALCHTNPTFAYGASLSIHHGFTLADIANRSDHPNAIALGFDDAARRQAPRRRSRLTGWAGRTRTYTRVYVRARAGARTPGCRPPGLSRGLSRVLSSSRTVGGGGVGAEPVARPVRRQGMLDLPGS
jgi:hypothetical protein